MLACLANNVEWVLPCIFNLNMGQLPKQAHSDDANFLINTHVTNPFGSPFPEADFATSIPKVTSFTEKSYAEKEEVENLNSYYCHQHYRYFGSVRFDCRVLDAKRLCFKWPNQTHSVLLEPSFGNTLRKANSCCLSALGMIHYNRKQELCQICPSKTPCLGKSLMFC